MSDTDVDTSLDLGGAAKPGMPPPSALPTPPAPPAEDAGAFSDNVDPYAGKMGARAHQIPHVTNDAEYAAVPAGSKFIDPDGVMRSKPITNDAEFAALPEGSEFVDPEGNTRIKPKYEPVNYTAQTLHSMAINPKEQRKALEYAYPGMVEEGPDGELFVNDNGVYRKPGASRGIKPLLGSITAGAAPTAGAVLGAIGGGAAAAPTGPGAVAGAGAGGAFGAVGGQYVNDMIFSAIAGKDRTDSEDNMNLVKAGLSGMAGAGVGRGVSTVVPSIKAGVSAAGAAAPAAARWWTGATKEGLETSDRLASRGYAVPPSAYAPDSPHLQNMAEVLDPAFRTGKPLMKQNYAAYEKDASQMLQEAGVPEFQGTADDLVKPSLTNPTAAIPTARVGDALKAKAVQAAQDADNNLKATFEQQRAAVAAGAPETVAQRQAITQARQESRQAVDNLLNENYADINRDVESAYNLAKVGANSGEAWQQAAEKLRATRKAIGDRSTKIYQESHAVGGDTPIPSTELSEAARDFAEKLPEDFRTTQPTIVRRLEQLAGEVDEKSGELIKPPTDLTFAELHELRTIMRSNADFMTLSSDVRNGAFKHFNNVIDNVIHDADALPHLKTAAELLDQADAFYREQIPIFHAKELQAVMKGVEAGEPANPIALYDTLVKANQPQMTARIRQMVGPNLWSAVQAAHVDDLMRRSMSKSVRGAIDGPAFARNVLADHNSGLLEQVQDRAMTDKLLKQVDVLAMVDGKLPVPVNSGDRLLDIIARARAAEAADKAAGKADPLTAIRKDAGRVNNEQNRALGSAVAARKKEPLGFLYEQSVGGQEAANKILSNPDLMVAAADKFGKDSTEFKMLQQTYLWKVLQGDMDPAGAMAKIAPEIQHLIFPGVRLDQLQQLAKDMQFLTGSRLMGGVGGDAGGSMMARAKVSKPPRPGFAGQVVKAVPLVGPVVDAASRTALGKFYAIVANLSTKPAVFTYMLKGLRGSEAERQATKQAIQAVLQRGTAIGAGAAEEAYQNRDR